VNSVNCIPPARLGGRLLIFDELFPYEASGFRLWEYVWLLGEFPNSRVIASLAMLEDHYPNVSRPKVQENFQINFPEVEERVIFCSRDNFMKLVGESGDSDLIYTIFLNQIWTLVKKFKGLATPFAFTLYPGGGFHLGRKAVSKLELVFSHPMFRGVIVTQPATLEFLKEKFPEVVQGGRVKYIFGGVLRGSFTSDFKSAPLEFLGNLNVCFIGNKYHSKGKDKGLDIFLRLVDKLHDPRKLNFHLVGPWSLSDIGNNREDIIQRWGVISNIDMPEFLSKMDIAVFPTRSSVIGRGSFDGFPVGSAVEAGLAGVAVVTTNPLGQESPLERGRDYLEIDPTLESALSAVQKLIVNQELLRAMKLQAIGSFSSIYSQSGQLAPRVQFLKCLMDGQ
jgi:glycosyltransferase involved in cell wall biosynthesis